MFVKVVLASGWKATSATSLLGMEILGEMQNMSFFSKLSESSI